jgi:hypothetical protein
MRLTCIYQESFSFLLDAEAYAYADIISHDPAANVSYDLKQVTSSNNKDGQYASLDDEDISVSSQITELFVDSIP